MSSAAGQPTNERIVALLESVVRELADAKKRDERLTREMQRLIDRP
jgi:hypothetical protein